MPVYWGKSNSPIKWLGEAISIVYLNCGEKHKRFLFLQLLVEVLVCAILSAYTSFANSKML